MHTKPNQNDGDTLNPNPHPVVNDPEHPGYEVTDVNVSGVLVFVSGLSIFVAIFFVVCFFIGKMINTGLNDEDGPTDKWHQAYTDSKKTHENLASNPVLEQQAARQIVNTFPAPRLDADDGNQSTTDLHAKEDLLLTHYSEVEGMPGTVRIPVERAMELIAERGLPVTEAAKTASAPMTGASAVVVTAPLTDGFARTGYEQEKMEERKQKLELEEQAVKEAK